MSHPYGLLTAKTETAAPQKAKQAQPSARTALRIYCYKNRTTPQEFFAKRREARKEAAKKSSTAAPEFKGMPLLVGSHFYI